MTVRHPRVETVSDLQLALARMEGRRAVVIFTLVEPTLRATMRELCLEAGVDNCDLLAEPLEAVAKVSGQTAEDAPARPAAARRELLQADRGDRVRGQERRRRGADARRRRRRPRRCLAHLEDPAFDLTSATSGWKATNVPLVKGIDPPNALFEIDPSRIVGLTIDAKRLAEIRSERLVLMGGDRRYANLNEIYEDLEHAAAIHKRIGCPVIDVSGALDRGDRAAHRPCRRTPAGQGSGPVTAQTKTVQMKPSAAGAAWRWARSGCSTSSPGSSCSTSC